MKQFILALVLLSATACTSKKYVIHSEVKNHPEMSKDWKYDLDKDVPQRILCPEGIYSYDIKKDK